MTEEIKVEIPWAQLSAEALSGVIDDYILREGTDYGAAEHTLPHKREQVMAQLRSGKAVIVFDAVTETCTVVLRADVPA